MQTVNLEFARQVDVCSSNFHAISDFIEFWSHVKPKQVQSSFNLNQILKTC